MGLKIYAPTDKVDKKTVGFIPFEEMKIKQSVFIHFDECKEQSLRALVSKHNSKGEKQFKVVKHNDHSMYEVSCISNTADFATPVKTCKYEIVDSSPQMVSFIAKPLEGKRVYPFAELPEGKSFLVPMNEAKENSLYVACCVNGKKFDKKFHLIKHEQYGVFEIGCRPKGELKFFENSPEMKNKFGGEE